MVSRTMSRERQLELWLAGNPQHNGSPEDAESECCPDFSCCRPELLQPLEVREAFCQADAKQMERFLGQFLGALLAMESE